MNDVMKLKACALDAYFWAETMKILSESYFLRGNPNDPSQFKDLIYSLISGKTDIIAEKANKILELLEEDDHMKMPWIPYQNSVIILNMHLTRMIVGSQAAQICGQVIKEMVALAKKGDIDLGGVDLDKIAEAAGEIETAGSVIEQNFHPGGSDELKGSNELPKVVPLPG